MKEDLFENYKDSLQSGNSELDGATDLVKHTSFMIRIVNDVTPIEAKED